MHDTIQQSAIHFAAPCKCLLWEYLKYFVISSCHCWVKYIKATCFQQTHLRVSDVLPNVFCQSV